MRNATTLFEFQHSVYSTKDQNKRVIDFTAAVQIFKMQ